MADEIPNIRLVSLGSIRLEGLFKFSFFIYSTESIKKTRLYSMNFKVVSAWELTILSASSLLRAEAMNLNILRGA